MSNYATVIERISTDALKRVEWRFYNLRELEMTLEWVIHFARPSKRHGWQRTHGWHRISRGGSDMPREEPPQEIKDELRRRINEALRFS